MIQTIFLLQLLAYEHEASQRAACATLLELAQDQGTAALIEREDAIPMLQETLKSDNPAIRSLTLFGPHLFLYLFRLLQAPMQPASSRSWQRTSHPK